MCDEQFAGWDENVIQRLPLAVAACFRFLLTHKGGVTMELHQRIIDARVQGGSLKQLAKELDRNRHTRMHQTVAAYWRHCEHLKLSCGFGKAQSILLHFHGQRAPHQFTPLIPKLSSPTPQMTKAYTTSITPPQQSLTGEVEQTVLYAVRGSASGTEWYSSCARRQLRA
jgi:hypothetical protein